MRTTSCMTARAVGPPYELEFPTKVCVRRSERDRAERADDQSRSRRPTAPRVRSGPQRALSRNNTLLERAHGGAWFLRVATSGCRRTSKSSPSTTDVGLGLLPLAARAASKATFRCWKRARRPQTLGLPPGRRNAAWAGYPLADRRRPSLAPTAEFASPVGTTPLAPRDAWTPVRSIARRPTVTADSVARVVRSAAPRKSAFRVAAAPARRAAARRRSGTRPPRARRAC